MKIKISALLLCLAFPLALMAQQEPDARVVNAPQIVKALSAKDIVVDRPGPARVVQGPSISLQVQFNFDSAELRPQGKRQLDELAMAFSHKSLVAAGFELAGHTDRVGDEAYNKKLSLERANAVKAYLQEAHGIAPERLQALGFGFERLADPAHPTAAINRRVEVRKVSLAVRPSPAPAASNGGRLVVTPK